MENNVSCHSNRMVFSALIIISTILLTLVSGKANAQRMGCVHNSMLSDSVHGDDVKRVKHDLSMLGPYDFDPQKTYRQPVVLITFSDMEFSMADPASYYNRLFNESGYNEGMGQGCVADYFRDQSDGRLNLQFDIYGPFKVENTAGGHPGIFYGETIIDEALHKLCETDSTDFIIYDWNGDSIVNQVVFITAGFSGNDKYGYIWPNTGVFYSKLPGGVSSYLSSVSCELWSDSSLYGIGTIIHEFCHCLGLPDIYPLDPATTFSTVDEWDLMDGGNYTNNGWCPPNLSAMEKMFLGWSSPVELQEPTTVVGMKPIGDGGETYIIRNTGNNDEFYLLENRQQKGWDYGCPGNGLLIFHVDYDNKLWRNNQVNVSDTYYRYDLFHTDGKDFRAWCPQNNGRDLTRWTMENRLRSCYLSTSPYPYTDPATMVVNDNLTDDSEPAAVLFTANADGRKLMGKSITNIRMTYDGFISFDFMKDTEEGIMTTEFTDETASWYSIDGRRLSGKPTTKGLYLQNGKKVVIK